MAITSLAVLAAGALCNTDGDHDLHHAGGWCILLHSWWPGSLLCWRLVHPTASSIDSFTRPHSGSLRALPTSLCCPNFLSLHPSSSCTAPLWENQVSHVPVAVPPSYRRLVVSEGYARKHTHHDTLSHMHTVRLYLLVGGKANTLARQARCVPIWAKSSGPRTSYSSWLTPEHAAYTEPRTHGASVPTCPRSNPISHSRHAMYAQ